MTLSPGIINLSKDNVTSDIRQIGFNFTWSDRLFASTGESQNKALTRHQCLRQESPSRFKAESLIPPVPPHCMSEVTLSTAVYLQSASSLQISGVWMCASGLMWDSAKHSAMFSGSKKKKSYINAELTDEEKKIHPSMCISHTDLSCEGSQGVEAYPRLTLDEKQSIGWAVGQENLLFFSFFFLNLLNELLGETAWRGAQTAWYMVHNHVIFVFHSVHLTKWGNP